MHEGYYLGGDYACSDECAVQNYMCHGISRIEAQKQFEDDLEFDDVNCIGEVYWTEWD